MRVVAIYREESEVARACEEFIHDFARQTGKSIEVVNPDDRAGQGFIETYNIMEYPTLIALDNDGRMLQTWSGLPLPRIQETSYYVD